MCHFTDRANHVFAAGHRMRCSEHRCSCARTPLVAGWRGAAPEVVRCLVVYARPRTSEGRIRRRWPRRPKVVGGKKRPSFFVKIPSVGKSKGQS